METQFSHNYQTSNNPLICLNHALSENGYTLEVEKNYNIVLGGGQQKLAGKIIRIGHMGWINQEDIEASIIALKETLDRL